MAGGNDFSEEHSDMSRNAYEEDSFKWLHDKFNDVRKFGESEWSADWRFNQTKEFLQNAAESVVVALEGAVIRASLWLGFIAAVALASARLWLGAGIVIVILAWKRYRTLQAARALWRFNYFRKHSFGELLKIAEGHEMLEGDKNFVLKCKDSLLYGAVVAENRREKVGSSELQGIYTLYREYCSGLAHLHTYPLADYADLDEQLERLKAGQMDDSERAELSAELNRRQAVDAKAQLEAKLKCPLCAAVHRIREHVEGVLSKFEADVETARQRLIARIDGGDTPAVAATEFLKQYRKWEESRKPTQGPLFETLRSQDNWTFEAADKVRELCRAEELGQGYIDDRERTCRLFDVLTAAMESAAAHCGVEDIWKMYNANKNLLCGRAFSDSLPVGNIRQALARHNPETTIRQLTYPHEWLSYELQRLKSFGFDAELARRELRAAQKFVRKEEKQRKYERLTFETASTWRWQAEEAERRVLSRVWGRG
jgi:hypothetical protein